MPGNNGIGGDMKQINTSELQGQQLVEKAQLHDHMLEVAKANGFDSLTNAITTTCKCDALVEKNEALTKRVGKLENHLREFVKLQDACKDMPHDEQVDLGYIDGWYSWDEHTKELLR